MLIAYSINGLPSNSKRALLAPIRELLPPASTNPVRSKCMLVLFQPKASKGAKQKGLFATNERESTRIRDRKKNERKDGIKKYFKTLQIRVNSRKFVANALH